MWICLMPNVVLAQSVRLEGMRLAITDDLDKLGRVIYDILPTLHH